MAEKRRDGKPDDGADIEAPRVIRGTISRLFHQSPTFCAGKMLPARGDVASPGEITFAGKVYVREGEAVALRGRWADHEKYGRQFQVSERIHEEAVTADALASWLAHHGQGLGIGGRRARKLAEEFGDNLSGWLRDDPEQMAIAAGVPLESIEALGKLWEERQDENAVFLRLAKYELTASQTKALYAKFKGSIVAILEEDPYLLLGEVPGLGFKKVDEIARKLGAPGNHPGRARGAILHCLGNERDDGSSCVERDHLVELVEALLDSDGLAVVELIERQIDELARIRKLRVIDGPGPRSWCALYWLAEHEECVSAFLREAQRPNPHFSAEDAEKLAAGLTHLDESQRRAVALALRSRACLISGGAGTGKSTLIAALARTYRDHLGECGERQVDDDSDDDHGPDGFLSPDGPPDWLDGIFDEIDGNVRGKKPGAAAAATIALAAPTGKAARRIEEAVGGELDASTIHRLLGYTHKGGFHFDADNPLRSDVVIVDEASMIDIELASHLFAAIGPDTAVVLVGDHHQLPPVGPGALLRDAIAGELLPMAILNQCHRQAGPLKVNAQAVLTGTVPPTVEWKGQGPGPWYVARHLRTADSVPGYVEKLFTRDLTANLGFDPIRDIQFLTPQHSGPIGTRALNALLQRLYQASLGVEAEATPADRRPKLHVGDKVIQTRNNYQLNVMNGHQGVVLSARPLVVQFDDRAVSIPADAASDIELAYCLTIHKMQGSQVPCVVVICHKAHGFMLHRNLLYTAVTRATKTCVIAGDPEGVEMAARIVKNNQRRTLLPVLASGLGSVGAER